MFWDVNRSYMQKVIAFLNKYSVLLNSIAILFWLYIITTSYLQIEDDVVGATKNGFVIPVIFILVSCFNIYLSIKRKNRK